MTDKSQRVKFGLALSGGGSRAMAFHLGCLRTLNEKNLLDKVELISSVSGGSFLAAMYAYSDDNFSDFETRVRHQLKKGFVGGIVKYTLLSVETPKILIAILTAGFLNIFGLILGVIFGVLKLFGVTSKKLNEFVVQFQAPLRRFASRSTAFEKYLRKEVFGALRLDQVKRSNLQIVINATEFKTGTAFRFGSKETGSWRFGILTGDIPFISEAVVASAAFPALLPSFDWNKTFSKNGTSTEHRVILTDGGVYDNLGISCMLPGRSSDFSTNAYQADYIICCSASAGQSIGRDRPYSLGARLKKTVTIIHDRTHRLSYDLLHRLKVVGETDNENGIQGFILPYLGQQDTNLVSKPDDFVTRDQVFDYPTDFSPMSDENMDLLVKRGEQLTRLLLEQYPLPTS